MKRPSLPLALAMLVGGCATDGGPYPSLAPRAVEKGSFDEPVRPRPVATPDAALDATIAARGSDLDRLVAGFDTARAAAERDIARPGAQTVGSDAWLDAQAALARLDDWRGRTVGLTSTIEALASARAQRLDPAYPALDELVARAGAESARQAEAVTEVQRRLPTA